jgi:hypothetical protein
LQVEVQGQTLKLPDFLLVGAAKSGTTSLADYLRQHPQIFMPEEKELHFFAFAAEPPSYSTSHCLGPVLVTDFHEYARYLSPAPNGAVIGEASVSYFLRHLYRRCIQNIQKFHPRWQELKIVIILRNPIERAFSAYVSQLSYLESKPFRQAIEAWRKREEEGWSPVYDYLGGSFYAEPLSAYKRTFPKTRVYLFEDLRDRPEWLMRDLYQFLSVNPGFSPEFKKLNPSMVPVLKPLFRLLTKPGLVSSVFPFVDSLLPLRQRVEMVDRIRTLFRRASKPQMKKEDRDYLKALFREDILRTQELIGRDLSKWLD